MKRLAKLKEDFYTYIFDSTVSLRDRSFVVFALLTIAELLLVAVPVGIFMHEPLSSTVATVIGAIFFAVYVAFSLYRKKLERAKVVIAVLLVFVFLPLMFFTNGGVNGGIALSILLGGVYITLILEGRTQKVMNVLYIISMTACWITAFQHPELVTQFSRTGNYIDTLSGLFVAHAVMYFLLTFQSNLYEKEKNEAKKKSEELEELNRAQNRFFSSMSHEIRTPINSILGLNELILRDESLSDEIVKDASGIQGAGKMLLALINDILDFSKIEAGSMDIVPVDYSVGDMLSEVVNMIWLKAHEKGLEFHVSIDPKVPAVLYGDEVRVKQIIINLLNNAVKYTKEGSVDLHIDSSDTTVQTTVLTISITDTGMGIKKEALPHLFDAFKRVDEEKNRNIEGTGLGLSIVKQLIDLMGGTVTVSSVYGEGSTFTVTLRQGVSDSTEVGVLNIHNQQNIRRTQYKSSFTAPEAKLLIVDDNEMNLEVESKLLADTEIAIDLATSGKAALEMALATRYDAILMDHLMPEMDGIECLEKIRNQTGGLNRITPIIVLTANAGSENRSLYTRAGFDGYLVKPVSGAALEDILLKHIAKDKLIIANRAVQMQEDIDATAGYARKAPVIISSTSLCDLPDIVIRRLRLPILPFLITTEEGVFRDGEQMDSNELIRYVDDGKNAVSSAPSVNAYTEFFASTLKRAHHVIHISLTTSMSKDYTQACEAAKSFDNVTVINSEVLSSATGILILIAYKLAQQDLPVEEIVAELEQVKHRLRCSFVLDTTQFLADRGYFNPRLHGIAKALNLHPSITFTNDVSGVGNVFIGSTKHAYRQYIRKVFPVDIIPDSEVVFITYANVPFETLQWVKSEISKIMYFERVIFQPAGAGIASNCGPGTIGILYFVKSNKTYNIGSLLGALDAEAREDADEGYEDVVQLAGGVFTEGASEEELLAQEEKWYHKLSCIDGDAAVENSGSEEAFKSVLKIFYDSIPAKTEELVGFFAAEDWENYKIRIHALKSSSKLIGALDLSEQAQRLETAAGEGDHDYIRASHPPFMEEYAKIGAQLSADVFGEEAEAQQDKPMADAFLMESVFEGLLDAAESYDVDAIEDIMKEIEDFSIPESDREKYESVMELAAKFDYDGIVAVLKQDQ